MLILWEIILLSSSILTLRNGMLSWRSWSWVVMPSIGVGIKASDGEMTIITYWVKDDGDKEEDEQIDFRLG